MNVVEEETESGSFGYFGYSDFGGECGNVVCLSVLLLRTWLDIVQYRSQSTEDTLYRKTLYTHLITLNIGQILRHSNHRRKRSHKPSNERHLWTPHKRSSNRILHCVIYSKV